MSVPIKEWTRGVQVEEAARRQLENIAALPIVWPHLAVMPDVHLGVGATVGSVVPTINAIIPAAVGVDIGCGMQAVQTTLRAQDLPDSLSALRSAIEAAVPHGRTNDGGTGDRGAWGDTPPAIGLIWSGMAEEYARLVSKHPKVKAYNTHAHLGTLGSGNHFIEVCLDRKARVWVMLHSGSRGVGNRIGTYFTQLAKKDMEQAHGRLPADKDLAYLDEGTEHFDDYVAGVSWAQAFASQNRRIMMRTVLDVLAKEFRRDHVMLEWPAGGAEVVDCHHNYVQKEEHFGRQVWLTRKGAVDATRGRLGIIPGSMGTRSYIVRGLGNPESFHSCSHGAGRAMSRGEARRTFSVADHVAATAGIECRKDQEVVDETPGAYKNIDLVMAAQSDLVEIVAELRQVLCVKG